jgi:N-acetylmuramic acid 6-phosphate etherase
MPAPDQPVLGSLLTEARNPASEHLDQLSTLEMLDAHQRRGRHRRRRRPRRTAADRPRCRRHRRALRAGWPPLLHRRRHQRPARRARRQRVPAHLLRPADLFQGLIAGGDRALRLSSEHSEDSREEGAHDLAAAGFGHDPDVSFSTRRLRTATTRSRRHRRLRAHALRARRSGLRKVARRRSLSA